MSVEIHPHHFAIREGDLLPDLVLEVHAGECCDGEDEPVDPADFADWTLTAIGPVTITADMTWDADAQTLTASWGSGDTDVPGNYLATVDAISRDVDSTSTSVAANTLTDTEQAMTVNAHAGHWLVDSAGVRWDVVSNTATAFTILGLGASPAAGAYVVGRRRTFPTVGEVELVIGPRPS